MKKVEYSQIVRFKLKELKQRIAQSYGNKVAAKTIDYILKNIENLQLFEDIGVKLSSLYDIECEYRIIHISKNYVIYRITYNKIIIVEMFDEREDFMYKLFGIRTLTQDNEEYWEK